MSPCWGHTVIDVSGSDPPTRTRTRDLLITNHGRKAEIQGVFGVMLRLCRIKLGWSPLLQLVPSHHRPAGIGGHRCPSSLRWSSAHALLHHLGGQSEPAILAAIDAPRREPMAQAMQSGVFRSQHRVALLVDFSRIDHDASYYPSRMKAAPKNSAALPFRCRSERQGHAP